MIASLPDCDSFAFWPGVLWPLVRLLLGMAAGLLLAALLETFQWTDRLARFASPLAKLARLNSPCSASFSMAFVSPYAANGILAENYNSGNISRRELIVANLFNSLPSFLTHLPSVLLLLWPALGPAALLYAAIALFAALIRLFASIIIGRLALSPPGEAKNTIPERANNRDAKNPWREARRRFLKRLPKLFAFTIPFYFLMLFLQHWGFFGHIERFFSEWGILDRLVNPRAISIIALQIFAETGATLGAAAALLDTGGVGASDIVVAMLVGSALATPIRAIRHQLPVYAGFFAPGVATRIILANQSLRLASVIAAIAAFLAISRLA